MFINRRSRLLAWITALRLVMLPLLSQRIANNTRNIVVFSLRVPLTVKRAPQRSRMVDETNIPVMGKSQSCC